MKSKLAWSVCQIGETKLHTGLWLKITKMVFKRQKEHNISKVFIIGTEKVR
jgi:hypothetical protein